MMCSVFLDFARRSTVYAQRMETEIISNICEYDMSFHLSTTRLRLSSFEGSGAERALVTAGRRRRPYLNLAVQPCLSANTFWLMLR